MRRRLHCARRIVEIFPMSSLLGVGIGQHCMPSSAHRGIVIEGKRSFSTTCVSSCGKAAVRKSCGHPINQSDGCRFVRSQFSRARSRPYARFPSTRTHIAAEVRVQDDLTFWVPRFLQIVAEPFRLQFRAECLSRLCQQLRGRL